MTPSTLLRGMALAAVAAAGAAFASEPLPEPMGIPMRTANTPMPGVSPFSAQYQAAYYQHQIDMRRYQAWMLQQAAARAAWMEARGAMGANGHAGMDMAMATAPKTGKLAALPAKAPAPVYMDAPAHLQNVPSGTLIKREVISEKVYRSNPDGSKTLVSSADFPAGQPLAMPATSVAMAMPPKARTAKTTVTKAVAAASTKTRMVDPPAPPMIVKVSGTETVPVVVIPNAVPNADGVQPAK